MEINKIKRIKIKKINTVENEDVYDINVDVNHNFFANGLLVHNCGEQILPIGGVCLLGSINLTQFIDFENRNWDFKKLKKLIPIAVRFMDNVNDKTNVPLPSQKESLLNKRRIGLGLLGYGSALMMMKMRYGSKEALELTEKLMSFLANQAYQASAILASEKGSFKLFNKNQYLDSKFIKQALTKETIDMISKYGLRNSHLLSIQPTGNSSVFNNNVSGGLEPIFMPKYIRTTIMPYSPEGLDKPKNIDWENKTYDSSTEWSWIKEGDENLLRSEFEGYVWKFDKSRGLLRENVVMDYAVRFLEGKNQWDDKADWAATTTELSIEEHINTMAIMSKYIDSAMSKTINIPNEYPFENFKGLYTSMFNTGTIKGGTTYRAGTMTTVLSDKTNDSDEVKIIRTDAPKRPKTLNCDVNHLTVQGTKWLVVVGLLNSDPYEIFAFKKKNINLSDKIKEGKLTKIKSGRYDLELDFFTLENLKEHFESDEEEALTRMVSMSLRHGAGIEYIYDQLQKSEGTIVSFSKAIARTLKRYLKDGKVSKLACDNCGSPDGLIMQEGCYICKDCSYSKC